jgi:hypothetical protein
MKAISKNKMNKKPSADDIAEMAMGGKDISSYFSNKGQMKPPIQRVNVDFTVDMLLELDEFARELNISRQAIIKSSLRQVLDQHNLAKKVRVV